MRKCSARQMHTGDETMIPDLPDVAGRSLSGTTYRISRTENELVCTSVGMTPAADGSAHPIYFYVATQVGMGETVGGLCAICNFDVKDGPLLGGCHVDFAESLRVETDYQVTGEILSLCPPDFSVFRRRQRTLRGRDLGVTSQMI